MSEAVIVDAIRTPIGRAIKGTLRDIRAKRWKLAPINPTHLEKLIALGLVEMRNDDPVLTNSGLDAIP